MMIVFPPVESDLLRLVDRTNQQPDADRQELDFRERDFDIARNHEPLVEHPIENIDEPGRSAVPLRQCRRHSLGILLEPFRRTRTCLDWSRTGRLISAMRMPYRIWRNLVWNVDRLH